MDPDYVNCDVYVVEAESREQDKKKAQAERRKQMRLEVLPSNKAVAHNMASGGLIKS